MTPPAQPKTERAVPGAEEEPPADEGHPNPKDTGSSDDRRNADQSDSEEDPIVQQYGTVAKIV